MGSSVFARLRRLRWPITGRGSLSLRRFACDPSRDWSVPPIYILDHALGSGVEQRLKPRTVLPDIILRSLSAVCTLQKFVVFFVFTF